MYLLTCYLLTYCWWQRTYWRTVLRWCRTKKIDSVGWITTTSLPLSLSMPTTSNTRYGPYTVLKKSYRVVRIYHRKFSFLFVGVLGFVDGQVYKFIAEIMCWVYGTQQLLNLTKIVNIFKGRLKLFRHFRWADSSHDYGRAFQAVIGHLPEDRRCGSWIVPSS